MSCAKTKTLSNLFLFATIGYDHFVNVLVPQQLCTQVDPSAETQLMEETVVMDSQVDPLTEAGLMDSQVDPEVETQLMEETGVMDSQVDPEAATQVEPGVRECQVRVRRLSDMYIKGCYTPCPLKGLAQQFRYLSNGQLYYDEKVISFHL